MRSWLLNPGCLTLTQPVAIRRVPFEFFKVPESPERVLVAMSGGVDSSVAALLLQRTGVPVEGAYMKNWINEENIVGNCPWEEDIEDARAVAESLQIPFRVVNLMREYRARVVEYLLKGY